MKDNSNSGSNSGGGSESGGLITDVWPIARYAADTGWSMATDTVAEELPVTIRLDGEEFATLVCSATDVTDLIYGFLAAEGIIMFAEDVASLDWDEQRGMADVRLKRRMSVAELDYGKRVIGSCCGKSRQFYLRTDARTAKTVQTRIRVTAAGCLDLMKALGAASVAFERTGGVHNAALCRGEGTAGTRIAGEGGTEKEGTEAECVEKGTEHAAAKRLLAVRTDIGRHNALDKLYGHALRNGIRTSDKLIAFSGRVSSEVLLKAAKIGVGVLVSTSAPTALALRLATDLGLTVIGFARGNRLNVYTHPARVDMES